ncbi:uncharacterized protein LOC131313908 [Rhododendron vialii]|uniref:uncharacterized protein LOC131313908 n=1 Tax=Rhododendron vialii TaxID=182163 RepID=UPI00265E1C18|nr:uncharacterized protein LOC131313908 [Rhododendron vialii]
MVELGQKTLSDSHTPKFMSLGHILVDQYTHMQVFQFPKWFRCRGSSEIKLVKLVGSIELKRCTGYLFKRWNLVSHLVFWRRLRTKNEADPIKITRKSSTEKDVGSLGLKWPEASSTVSREFR